MESVTERFDVCGNRDRDSATADCRCSARRCSSVSSARPRRACKGGAARVFFSPTPTSGNYFLKEVGRFRKYFVDLSFYAIPACHDDAVVGAHRSGADDTRAARLHGQHHRPDVSLLARHVLSCAGGPRCGQRVWRHGFEP